MFIKARLKFMRKHDCDFWNLMYYNSGFNRFFKYFQLSLMYKVNLMTQNHLLIFSKKRSLQISTLHGNASPFYFFNVFLNERDGKFINIKKNINFYKLFKNNSLRYVTHILKKGFYSKPSFQNDILLGVRSSFRLYKPLKENKMRERKTYFKQITLFYNNFDSMKLKRFSRLGRKGLFGGINYFFILLESRVDSILLRFNLGSKFFVRNFILSRNVLVDNKPIKHFNLIVKNYQFIHFPVNQCDIIIYRLLKQIKEKVFFVQPPFYMEINYRTLMILIMPALLDPSFIAYPFFSVNSKLITGLHTVLWGW